MTDAATTLYIVRHGESQYNQKDIIAGQIDVPLTDKGRKQALQAKQVLNDVHFDVAYSSDLVRAIETGEIIFGGPIPADHQKPALRERDYGSLTGKPGTSMQQAMHEIMLALPEAEGRAYKHVHDMESDNELADRFIDALQKLAKENKGKTILVGAHGAAIRTTLARLQNLSYAAFPAGSFKNASYVKLKYNHGHLLVEEVVN
jgi:broad specificity phosphatase PhoE